VWISGLKPVIETILPVYKAVDNFQVPVDNLWIKPELSTGKSESRLIHRLSTTCPQLVHRVIHRVIHNFL
jgi:hypothetical protein